MRQMLCRAAAGWKAPSWALGIRMQVSEPGAMAQPGNGGRGGHLPLAMCASATPNGWEWLVRTWPGGGRAASGGPARASPLLASPPPLLTLSLRHWGRVASSRRLGD